MHDEHEEPGWPTPEEEAAFDRAAEAAAPVLAKQTEADRERLFLACDEARRYRLEREAAGNKEASRP
jgi:hypothetical protein